MLLERAFAETIATSRAVKPWPWADTWPEARITVKRIGASAIALAGSSGQALAFGPGHVERTAEAGEVGIAVYAAHRDTHFRFLKDVAIGDEIDVTRHDGKTFRYRADGSSIVRFDQSGIDPFTTRPRTRSHHLLAVRRDGARADALRAACDDDFAADAATGTLLAACDHHAAPATCRVGDHCRGDRRAGAHSSGLGRMIAGKIIAGENVAWAAGGGTFMKFSHRCAGRARPRTRSSRSTPAFATSIDLSTWTCAKFQAAPKDDIGVILAWMDGYYRSEDDPPVIDTEKFVANAKKLGEYCAKHPDTGLITAADEVFAK